MDAPSRVALYLKQRIAESPRTQREIAQSAGFDNPNIITMFKQGKTKLPLDRVGPIAHALEIDPVHLLKLCLQEYTPETWDAIAPFFDTLLTPDETRLVRSLREHVGQPFLAALSPAQLGHLQHFLDSLQEQAPAFH